MKKSLVVLTAVISLLSFSTQTLACVSSSYSQIYAAQYDIPSTYDLAIGKLPIHSNAYYNFIIQNKLEKIQKNSITLDEYDDLAVAYNKIGEKQKAIEVLLPIVKDNPTRFSSVSNLGSTYLNMGDYENGLKYLKIANTLKPIDSYDREYAQEKVYSYLKARNKIPPYSFPIQDIESGKNFADFALQNIPLEKQNDEIIRLIFGIENMVRFGNHDSPVSMEVLGDLFLRFKDNNNLYQYQLNENITGFYNAAIIKSAIKNEDILNKILAKNSEYYNKNSLLQMTEDVNKVKEGRKVLEEKEKKIILESQDIEKNLNEDLISKNKNEKPSIMKEKDRLYHILKVKKNHEEARNYLQYTGLVEMIALFLIAASILISLLIVWGRKRKLIKHIDLQNEEFYNINRFSKYCTKTALISFIFGIVCFLTVMFNYRPMNVIGITTFVVTLISTLLCLIFLAISNYLIAFGKYKSDHKYHLSTKKNMKKLIFLGMFSFVLLLGNMYVENYIHEKYDIHPRYSFNIFGGSSGINHNNLRTIN